MKKPTASHEGPVRAVLYARSAHESASPDSIARQLEYCREYAARHGLVVVGEFTDTGAAPSPKIMPPGYRGLLAAAVREAAAAVVVFDRPRLGRDHRGCMFVYDELDAHGLHIGVAVEPERAPAPAVEPELTRIELDALGIRQAGEGQR